MELKISNQKLESINFPERKLRTTSEKNWNSPKKVVILDPKSISICGKTGDVLIRCKIDPHTKKDLIENISFKDIYFPESIDPEIEQMLLYSEKIKLRGKTIEEANIFELIDSGILALQ